MESLFIQRRGQGPDLVLLHGWGLNSGVWEQLSIELQQHFRVTLIDLPGFGRNSDVYLPQYHLAQLAQTVCAYVPEGASLLGWSMGGLVAKQIALDAPQRVGRLILVASSPCFPQSGQWHGIKPNVLNVFETQLEKDFSKTLDRFLAIQALGSDTARRDIKRIREDVQAYPIPNIEALRHGLSILAESDLRHRLTELQMPTHRIYGRLDSLVPHAVIPMIEALHPSESVHVFKKASHAPFISHPEAFLHALYDIFDLPVS